MQKASIPIKIINRYSKLLNFQEYSKEDILLKQMALELLESIIERADQPSEVDCHNCGKQSCPSCAL